MSRTRCANCGQVHTLTARCIYNGRCGRRSQYGDPVRFEVAKFDSSTPKFISLENTMAHKRFEHLPFMRTKNIVSNLTNNSTDNKWDVIYNLWKNNRASFNQYVEGDVHDTLLLAEELFDVKTNS